MNEGAPKTENILENTETELGIVEMAANTERTSKALMERISELTKNFEAFLVKNREHIVALEKEIEELKKQTSQN